MSHSSMRSIRVQMVEGTGRGADSLEASWGDYGDGNVRKARHSGLATFGEGRLSWLHTIGSDGWRANLARYRSRHGALKVKYGSAVRWRRFRLWSERVSRSV